MSDNKRVFTAELGGKAVELAVLRPGPRAQQQAQLVFNRAFRLAVKPEDGKPGAIVRAALEGVLREQKLWDDAKQRRYEELRKALDAGERQLAAGGIKLSKAREVAVQLRRDRWELRQLLAQRNELDLVTADAQAENARFNFLVAACTVYADTGKPVWKDEEAYLAAGNEPAAAEAAQALGHILYNLDEDFEKKLPENKWLVTYGFANADLHLVDRDGNLVDAQGRRVNDKGQLVDADGNPVDADGNPLTEDGQFKVDFQPFLADDGTPVPVPAV